MIFKQLCRAFFILSAVLFLTACGGEPATTSSGDRAATEPAAAGTSEPAAVEATEPEMMTEAVDTAPTTETTEPEMTTEAVDTAPTTETTTPEMTTEAVDTAPAAETTEPETATTEPAETTPAVETVETAPTAILEPLPGEISLPPGFRIGYYAENVPNARSMALSPAGTLFVGARRAGNLYAIPDADGDYQGDAVITLQQGMNSPNGVAFRDGALYVAEIDRVLRYDDIEAALPDLPEPVVINDDYPGDSHHGWKFIRFGPDGRLYVPVGAPCNVCETAGTPYGKITSIAPDGTDLQIYAEGVRNSVGFDWHPETGVLWFTDNGRDNLGDDIPPDELNRAPEAGLHFGFPYCHGGTIPDPQFDERDCQEFTPPAQPLGPHVASLGMRFYTGRMFPETYRNQIFIAEHGSWNRTEPIGYRISLVRLAGDEVVNYEVFAEGWLQDDGQAWGRPVDVQLLPDGSMLVSDDRAGAIYRIWYEG